MLVTDNADFEEKEPDPNHDTPETPSAPIRIVL
jgi:hypothetical protein